MSRLTHSPAHRLTPGLLCLLLAGCQSPTPPPQARRAAPADFCLTLAWDPSPDPDVTGYRLHWGNAPRTYTNSIAVANVTTQRVCGLNPAARYYFAATAATKALQSASAMMSATGLGSLGLAGAAIIGIFATMQKWVKMVKAELNVLGTMKAMDESTNIIAERLKDVARKAAESGQITQQYAKQIALVLDRPAPGNIKRGTIAAIQHELRDYLPPEMIAKRDEQAGALRRELFAGTLDPEARKRYQAETQLLRDLKEISAILNITKAQEKELTQLAYDKYDATVKQLKAKQDEAKVEVAPGTLFGTGYAREFTSLEKMGFVMNGGRGVTDDHNRAIADHTRRSAEVLIQIRDRIASPSPTNSFGNL